MTDKSKNSTKKCLIAWSWTCLATKKQARLRWSAVVAQQLFNELTATGGIFVFVATARSDGVVIGVMKERWEVSFAFMEKTATS